MRKHPGKVGIKLALHFHSVFQPELKDGECAFDAAVNIHLLFRRQVHVGVFFDGSDQFRDPSGGGFDLPRESFRSHGGYDPRKDL